MIVDAFTESLELGLEKPGQVVVSANRLILSRLALFVLIFEGFPI